MRRPKQIITALSLLIIMGIPGILFVYYQARQAYIRHEMEEKLEYQHLETLRLPASKVVWYEEGKEIIVEGKLFDVKTQTEDGSLVVFTGLFDDKETLVKNQMEKLQKEQSGETGDETLVEQIVSFELFHDIQNGFTLDKIVLVPHNYISFTEDWHLLPELTPPSPPPKA